MKAKLLDTINRIYETQLCKLELESLGAEDVSFDLDNLEFKFAFDPEQRDYLSNRTSWLTSIDGKDTWITKIIDINRKILRKYADIWFSHFTYPFKARFRPPVARSLINIVNPEPDGIILDNFCGSGTTQVEAILLGLDSVGIDINPFYTFLTQAQREFYIRKLTDGEIAEKFFIEVSQNPDRFKNAMLAGTIHPLMFVIYSYATCMHFPDSQKAFNRKFLEMKTLQDEWSRLNTEKSLELGEIKTVTDTAEKLEFPDNYFSGIVTSPPYSNALDYTKENRGAPEFFPVTDELKRQYEPVKKPDLYFEMMSKAISEMVRVLKLGKKIGFIIGNQRKKNEIIPIVDWSIEEFEKNNCKLLFNIPQLISSTGTWNILVDHILILQKRVSDD
ncbi:MAG: DNA methyltransferase [Elusimicrobiota bacterium]